MAMSSVVFWFWISNFVLSSHNCCKCVKQCVDGRQEGGARKGGASPGLHTSVVLYKELNRDETRVDIHELRNKRLALMALKEKEELEADINRAVAIDIGAGQSC
ncbi:hypothetical protein TSUD_352550 [Trifolium subterraneum]|nr:hypothetical protein TSUD_352550 [Trifolium subterraneum]